MNNLKSIRSEQSLSQPFVAKLLDIPVAQYHAYESGQMSIPFCDILNLARLFGVSYRDVISEQKYSNKDTIAVQKLRSIATY